MMANPSHDTEVSLADKAAALAEYGLAVFPCYSNKRPTTHDGFKSASSNPDTARALFAAYPTAALIGVRMGNGIFAIDVDSYKSPQADVFIEGLRNDGLLPETRTHRTKSGGVHYIYSVNPNVGDCPTVYPADGVDVRGVGSYIIWWPSVGLDVLREGVTEAPDALVLRLKTAKRAQSDDSIEALKARVLRAEVFHDSLSRLAARYSAAGRPAGEVTKLLLETLRGSVASSPHHERHERWRALLADKEHELSRLIETAHMKYNPTAASGELADALRESESAGGASQRITAASAVFFQAQEQSVEVPTDVWPFANEGYFANTDHNLLEQKFVMHPIICEDESVLIAAEPKTGKTAISLTVGLHVACGINFGEGLKVAEPRAVIYFGLEGRRAIRLRIAAWRKYHTEHGTKLPDFIPMFVVESGQNLMEKENRNLIAKKLAAANVYLTENGSPTLGMIVIDTFTKSMPGGDQNSVEDTSAVFDIVSDIRALGINAAIVFIHHKSRTGNVRGSTNIEADPDVLTSIYKEADVVTWSLDRARSVEEGGNYRFSLNSYDLGKSEQGFVLNAPVAVPLDYETTSGAMSEGQDEQRFVATLVKLGAGKHDIVAVYNFLKEHGITPIMPSGKAKVTAKSAVLQEWVAKYIPQTGRVFGNYAITAINTGGFITHLFIR